MSIYLLIALLYDITLVTICGFAFLRGGRPEKIGAAVNFAGSTSSSVLRLFHVASWAPAELTVLCIDMAVAASFFLLAVRSNRFWPIWAFGFLLADIFVSIAGVLLPRTPWLAYQSGLAIYAYLAMAALAIGTYCLPCDATAEQRSGRRARWKPSTRT